VEDAMSGTAVELDATLGEGPRRSLSSPHLAGVLAHRRIGVPLVVSGVAAVVLAALGLGLGVVTDGEHGTTAGVAPAVQPPPPPSRMVTPGDVVVVRTTYQPGESSGWHVHPGLHAVAVLSGSLTVYDELCQPRVVGPGDSYVGGQQVHLARNEGQEAVEMVVTGIDVSGPADSVTPKQAPAQCGDR
jgi:quercetin dioxygenase-like cupin family protein